MQAEISEQGPRLAAAGQNIAARPRHSTHCSQNVDARAQLRGSLPRWPWRPPKLNWDDLVVRGGGGFLARTSAGLVSHGDQASRHFPGGTRLAVYPNPGCIPRSVPDLGE
jgi:hypothetical protein